VYCLVLLVYCPAVLQCHLHQLQVLGTRQVQEAGMAGLLPCALDPVPLLLQLLFLHHPLPMMAVTAMALLVQDHPHALHHPEAMGLAGPQQVAWQ
jgi:hypothetical protein